MITFSVAHTYTVVCTQVQYTAKVLFTEEGEKWSVCCQNTMLCLPNLQQSLLRYTHLMVCHFQKLYLGALPQQHAAGNITSHFHSNFNYEVGNVSAPT